MTVLSRDPAGARALGVEALAGTRARAGARRGARRPRRRRPPRRRERRPALERRRQAAHPRLARARHAQPRRRPARGRAARRACSCRASAVGYYGPRGDERLDEDDAGRRRLPRRGVRRLGARGATRPRRSACASSASAPASCSTRSGGALAKMLPPFKLGVGGPVAGGAQYMPWIHVDDVVGIYLARARRRRVAAARSTPPRPSRSPTRTFSHGARPRAAPARRSRPVPGFASALLYGEMAEIVDQGPARGPEAHARARLRVPPPRPRRGAARPR